MSLNGFARPLWFLTHVLDLLRVVRRGHAVKTAVDDAIDQCSAVYHLTEAIEEAHTRAEEATDQKQKQGYAAKGTDKNICSWEKPY